MFWNNFVECQRWAVHLILLEIYSGVTVLKNYRNQLTFDCYCKNKEYSVAVFEYFLKLML